MRDEHFIELIKKHPALYDTNLPDYRDLGTRTEAWVEVAQQANLTAEECKLRWCKLRNCFTNALKRRCRKSAHSTPITTPWRYQAQMKFLIPHMESKSFPETTDIVDDQQSEDCEETETLKILKIKKENSRKRPAKDGGENENAIFFDELPVFQDSPPSSIKEFELNKGEMDETDMFFISMSKQLKKLPRIDQVQIKFDLHKAIHDVEMKILNNEQYDKI